MIAYLGLGSNVGDRFLNLKEAVHRLDRVPGIRVRKVSPVYETVSVGGPEQPDYLNTAVEIYTGLEPEKLLSYCLGIENEMGRVRTVPLGPRIIDIDIELLDGCIHNSDVLTVPHPRMHERAFILCPLADIAPDIVHPVMGLSIKELLAKIGVSGVRKYGLSIENY